MSSESKELDLLLNDIEMSCDPAIGSEECSQFSVHCLFLIRHRLPPIAEEGLALTIEYLEGRVPFQSVTDMLVRCWRYLKENHEHAPLNDPVASAIRAVIFPLDAQQHPEKKNIVDHLSFFLMLINNVEPHLEEENSLLRTHFAKCLKAD